MKASCNIRKQNQIFVVQKEMFRFIVDFKRIFDHLQYVEDIDLIKSTINWQSHEF